MSNIPFLRVQHNFDTLCIYYSVPLRMGKYIKFISTGIFNVMHFFLHLYNTKQAVIVFLKVKLSNGWKH